VADAEGVKVANHGSIPLGRLSCLTLNSDLSGESAQIWHTPKSRQGQFTAHLEAKKNSIMAAVKFDRSHQLQAETFDSFVTDF